MAVDWEEMLITVRAGVGQPPEMRIAPDETLGPLSIGSSGSWCIVAPGVLGEHGYLYFDGTDLFLQSADPQNPLLVDGQPVPDVWTPVYCPCEISLGVARLLYSNPGQTVRLNPAGFGQTLPLGFVPSAVPKRPQAARATPIPSPVFDAPQAPLPPPSFDPPLLFGAPPPPEATAAPEPPIAGPDPVTSLQLPPKRARTSKSERPFAPGAFSTRGPDPDVTRLHPIEITAAGRGARLKLPEGDDAIRPMLDPRGSGPPAPPPSMDPFSALPLLESMPVAPPQPPPGTSPSGMPQFGAPPGVPVHMEAPPVGSPQMAAPKAQGGPTAASWLKARWQEASTPQKLFLVLLPPLIGSVWIIFTDVPPPPTRPAAPRASATATASAAPTLASASESSAVPEPPIPSEKPAASATARTAETSRVAAPPPPPPATGKTAQREAADAVAIGDFEGAARLYEELAKAHPEIPAYAEAARIMRAKVKR